MKKTEEMISAEGHRARLRQKVLKNGEALEDYELLELLLTYAIPRKDVKPLAKELIARFGSYGNVVNADPEALLQVKGVKENTTALIKALKLSNLKILEKEIVNANILDSWIKIENYCHALLGREAKEHLYVISLDGRLGILGVDEIQKGTVNHAAFHVREIMEKVIQRGAVAFIIVHNHPSGNTMPSKDDIECTKDALKTANLMNIKLYDHIIVSKHGINSFKSMGII